MEEGSLLQTKAKQGDILHDDIFARKLLAEGSIQTATGMQST